MDMVDRYRQAGDLVIPTFHHARDTDCTNHKKLLYEIRPMADAFHRKKMFDLKKNSIYAKSKSDDVLGKYRNFRAHFRGLQLCMILHTF